ncbi:MAG: efflux RND transporter permease subunit, partial [Candidatus Acidiferrum sp.]
MSGFSVKYPFLIIVACLVIAIVGTVTLVRMPVDLFPPINIPVVVVATFYSGMPPQQIETNITNPFERFFTLASGVDHIESRSLPGVSLIKIYFQAGTNADSDVSAVSNLAMADLRRLPPGTLPPVVLKFDASSLPVCLITLKGQGLNETELHDIGQYTIRNQIANVPGASVPQPFGGLYRQIMVYVDPMKLQAHELSPMDVVRQINESNLILPAGDVKIGPFDYNLYSNSQAPSAAAINSMPLKTVGQSSVLVGDIGKAVDAQAIQTNIVRVDGQPSVYLPILKQGGDTNTIAVVDGIRAALRNLVDIPQQLKTRVVFDQSLFVKTAIDNLIHEGAIGLILTGVMILLFLGSLRATAAVFLSIPLSALAAFLAISAGGGTVNTMVLGGLALVFSRLIDNSVIVLENIFRHLEMGEAPEEAAVKGGQEVALAVLAATLTTAVVFFPVLFLYGVSRFLFVALATAVILSLFASYFVAMTVVPLFCAKFISGHQAHEEVGDTSFFSRFGKIGKAFNVYFDKSVAKYDRTLAVSLRRPVATVVGLAGVSLLSMALYPFLGVSFFPRTDPGQFVINLKAPSGTRVEVTQDYVKQVEDIIRNAVPPNELQIIVANIGLTTDFSAIYTSNAGPHTAFVQVSLKEGHKTGSYEYMRRVRQQLSEKLPQLSTYFQSGGLVDAVINLGLPAPIDIQVSGNSLREAYATAAKIAGPIRDLKGVSDILIPQDIDYPALLLDIDREKAGLLGLSQKEVVDNVITALTSNGMIAPNYWIDPKSGNPYMLTVQYPENSVKSITDLKQIPLRGAHNTEPTSLDSVVHITSIPSPTEVDHYQLQRVIDIYVSPKNQDLGDITRQIERIVKNTVLPEGVRVNLRG